MTAKKTCKKILGVLTGTTVEIEPGLGGSILPWTAERELAKAEEFVTAFNEFLREHRAWNGVRVLVSRTCEDQCSVCHSEWESDEDNPECCAHCGAVIEKDETK